MIRAVGMFSLNANGRDRANHGHVEGGRTRWRCQSSLVKLLDKGVSICYNTVEMQRLEASPSTPIVKTFLRRGIPHARRATAAVVLVALHNALPGEALLVVARCPWGAAALTLYNQRGGPTERRPPTPIPGEVVSGIAASPNTA